MTQDDGAKLRKERLRGESSVSSAEVCGPFRTIRVNRPRQTRLRERGPTTTTSPKRREQAAEVKQAAAADTGTREETKSATEAKAETEAEQN